MNKSTWLIILALLPIAISAVIFSGCETNSGDDFIRNVAINITGHYKAPEGNSSIVYPCSGKCPEYLNLSQYGDSIEAFDDNGLVYKGTIGSVNSEAKSCTFTMTGKSQAGADVTMNGTIQVDGTSATMEGSWIEPNLYGAIYAVGSVTDEPSNTLTMTASPTSLSSGQTSSLTASGGDGNYKWSTQTDSYGSLDNTTGASVTYTAATVSNNVTQVITVTDGAGTMDTKQISQSP
jgi:hypothetical protein